MSDVFTAALNAPSGRLAEILLRKFKRGKNNELPRGLRTRLNRLVDSPGKAGTLARVRLAADVPFLFERAPKWTKDKILPLFDWSSANAIDVWSSRKYSNYIGSPELFGLTKKPFLEIFGRKDVPTDDMGTFAEWLTTILIANQANDAGYPLLATEARTALRRAGAGTLSSVGHRLAVEMERAKPNDKITCWQNIVGPVFQAMWPLDVDLQTSRSTFKLAQILLASGEAFPEAADIIIPYIRPEDPRGQTTAYSISEAPEQLYRANPKKMLDLIAAVIGEASPANIYGLNKVLSRLRAIDPNLADTRKFQKLMS